MAGHTGTFRPKKKKTIISSHNKPKPKSKAKTRKRGKKKR